MAGAATITAAKVRIAPLEVLALTFIALLFLLGGGGTPAPQAELACQLLAAAAAAAWVWLQDDQAEPVPPRIWWVLALVAAIPVIQLVPLPPALWQRLPGRGVLQDALELVNLGERWWPISVAPQTTLGGLLIMAPPALVLIMVARLDWAARNRLLALLALLGLGSVVVGAAQLAAAGTSTLQFYGSSNGRALYGFQANYNAQADVLLIALLALCAAWANTQWPSRTGLVAATAAVGALLLILGTVLTSSRAGIGLILVALGWAATMLFDRGRIAPTPGQLRLAVIGFVATLLTGLALARTAVIARVLDRFDFTAEARPDLWRDSWFAAQQYWPFGTGLGTFSHAFPPAERLEAIGSALPNHAHNEVLELLIEGGLPLLTCWLGIALLVGRCCWRSLRQPSSDALVHNLFAAGSLSILTLHSAVDYPFRSVAVAMLAAVAAGLVLAPQTNPMRGNLSRGSHP